MLFLCAAFLAKGAEVSAGLIVPAAQTHVIGDEIRLTWVFTNQTDQPLAFMWEGCCRLNGRLSVSALDQAVATLPPGPSTAHQFPRAVRIEAGAAREFETLLSDWVRLPESGTYELRGSYVGVLENQKPQVPRSVSLWRGKTETPPLQLEVMSVADYLRQRSARERAQELTLSVTGPETLSLSSTSQYRLSLRNTATRSRSFSWPQSARLWLVDRQGARASGVSHYVRSPEQEITLPAQEEIELSFTLDAHDLIGIPLGHYQLFIDWTADGERPRLPSNPLPVRWEITQQVLGSVLEEATQRTGAATRNLPLRLLRTYLGDLGPMLGTLPTDSAKPQLMQLRSELALAACLKEVAPRPGSVELILELDAAGNARFQHETIRHCVAKANTPAEQLSSILEVRKHLGWDVRLILQPDARTTARAIFKVAADLTNPDLGNLPAVVVPHPKTGLPISVWLQSRPTSANAVLRVNGTGPELRLALARRLPDPAQPQLTAHFQPEELDGLSFASVKADDLQALLKELPSPRTLLLVKTEVAWSDLRRVVALLGDFGTPLDMVVD